MTYHTKCIILGTLLTTIGVWIVIMATHEPGFTELTQKPQTVILLEKEIK